MAMHKAHGGRLKLQQPMDGFGFQSCRLRQAFGRTSGGGTEQHIHLLGLENLEDTGDNRRLPDSRPTSDHGDFALQGHCHGITL